MRHIVVCGLGRFGLQVVESLRAADAAVIVVSSPGTRADRIERAVAVGARYLEGDFRFASVRRDADLENARAVVLATADDVVNLETALEVRGEAPDVRIVMRMAEPRLAHRLESDFGIAKVLSPAFLAADAFVAAALDAPSEPGHFVPLRRLPPIPRRPRRVDFLVLPILLAVLFLGGVVLFHTVLDMDWTDASYFTATIVTTVGFGDYNLHDAPPPVKIFGILLMFGGVVLVAMLSSVLTNYVISGAAGHARNEALARRQHGHVVVCGLGRVGYAIAHDLRERGVPVVVVDIHGGDDVNREMNLRCPLVLGDAARSETLLRAGLDRARALIACTSNDALNLEIGLVAQTLVEERRGDRPLRLVLRCFDADLARRIHAVSDNYTILSEAKIAAPFFVDETLAKEDAP